MFRFLSSARVRRRILIPLAAALFGAVAVLMLEWTFFRPRSVPLPVVVSTAPRAPLAALAPHELENRIRVSPCVDLHSYVCTLVKADDPTGDVRRDSEGEVEVLRIYENIIRTNRRLSPEKIDELLVKKIYTPERTRRIRDLFVKAKEHILKFIDSQPFQALSEMDKDTLRKRIERVVLELPPPAAVYADEPDLYTRNDVFYERTVDGNVRIRMGGALLFTVRSQFNLAFTLTHELAHAIDPCELRSDKIDILSYRSLAECFGSPADTLASECSARGKLAEVFADWVATHVVAEILTESAKAFTPSQVRSAVYNTVRDLCREEDDDQGDVDAGLASSHPNVAFRVNRIFAQHPQIRKLLGCRDMTGPALPGVPSYCFWPTGAAAQAVKDRDVKR
ncbi:MAG: hypothetical protein HY075_15810 [Deltaproteobacteria bacterium]|nr:hypothetical protein [Deltaproteobacteria bacterium]